MSFLRNPTPISLYFIGNGWGEGGGRLQKGWEWEEMEEIRAMGLGALLPRQIFQDFFIEWHKVRTRSAQGYHWPARPGDQSGENNVRHASAFSAQHIASTVFATE